MVASTVVGWRWSLVAWVGTSRGGGDPAEGCARRVGFPAEQFVELFRVESLGISQLKPLIP